MSDRKFMLLAVEKAAQGVRSGQTPFGACIVRKGKIISCAHNVVWKTTDITAHAEIQAIREACRRLKTVDLSGCVIYSTCEPCPMCFSACHWAKISKIVYGTSIADAKSAGFNELSVSNFRMKRLGKSPLEIRGGFMRRENLALFEAWSALKNRKVY
jgi:tRNA(Arg) A34 adenosine deaminase TadA